MSRFPLTARASFWVYYKKKSIQKHPGEKNENTTSHVFFIFFRLLKNLGAGSSADCAGRLSTRRPGFAEFGGRFGLKVIAFSDHLVPKSIKMYQKGHGLGMIATS